MRWREVLLALSVWLTAAHVGLAFRGPAIPVSRNSATVPRNALSSKAAIRGQMLDPATTRTTTNATGILDKLFIRAFLPPYVARDTERYQVGNDIWMFEQTQTFLNVSVNIRMTVVRLKSGGLFVHAPLGPTPHLLRLLGEVGGEVEYVVLPVTAVEHKVYMKPFTEKFPNAKVYTAPRQYSFPLNLPLDFRVDGDLVDKDKDKIPFIDEIDFTTWSVTPFPGSAISETAFFHKASKTLLVTDAVVYVPDKAPDLLRGRGLDAADRYWWQKSALLATFIARPNLDTFPKIANKVFVSPVYRLLVVPRAKQEIRAWLQRIAEWDFNRIIPAHFSAPIVAKPQDLLNAYAFIFEDDPSPPPTAPSSSSTPVPPPRQQPKWPSFFPRIPGASPSTASSTSRPPRRPTAPPLKLPETDLYVLNAVDRFVSLLGIKPQE